MPALLAMPVTWLLKTVAVECHNPEGLAQPPWMELRPRLRLGLVVGHRKMGLGLGLPPGLGLRPT